MHFLLQLVLSGAKTLLLLFYFFFLICEFCAREKDIALPQALGAGANQEPKSLPAEPSAHVASFAGISTLLCKSQSPQFGVISPASEAAQLL